MRVSCWLWVNSLHSYPLSQWTFYEPTPGATKAAQLQSQHLSYVRANAIPVSRGHAIAWGIDYTNCKAGKGCHWSLAMKPDGTMDCVAFRANVLARIQRDLAMYKNMSSPTGGFNHYDVW